MIKTYRIFCDESCHLEHDNSRYMVLGGIMVDDEHYESIKNKIKEIRHNFKFGTEIKWTKVSSSRIEFYKAVIDLFFSESSLQFRAVVVDKEQLHHEKFNDGGHDQFYYKMFYYVVNHFVSLDSASNYKIFFDYKDTKNRQKLEDLNSVFMNEYKGKINIAMQTIRSHDSQLIGIVDLLIGAISYKVRGVNTSSTKKILADYLKNKSQHPLNSSSYKNISKFNIFRINLEYGESFHAD